MSDMAGGQRGTLRAIVNKDSFYDQCPALKDKTAWYDPTGKKQYFDVLEEILDLFYIPIIELNQILIEGGDVFKSSRNHFESLFVNGTIHVAVCLLEGPPWYKKRNAWSRSGKTGYSKINNLPKKSKETGLNHRKIAKEVVKYLRDKFDIDNKIRDSIIQKKHGLYDKIISNTRHSFKAKPLKGGGKKSISEGTLPDGNWSFSYYEKNYKGKEVKIPDSFARGVNFEMARVWCHMYPDLHVAIDKSYTSFKANYKARTGEDSPEIKHFLTPEDVKIRDGDIAKVESNAENDDGDDTDSDGV